METKITAELFSENIFKSTTNGVSWKVNFAPEEVQSYIDYLLKSFKKNNNQIFDFGNFKFKKHPDYLEIVDGEKRIILISIIIFTVVMKLRSIRVLSKYEIEIFIKFLKDEYRYKTILSHDNQLFRDCLDGILQSNLETITIDTIKTQTGKLLFNTIMFISEFFDDKDESFLISFLNFIVSSKCSFTIVN